MGTVLGATDEGLSVVLSMGDVLHTNMSDLLQIKTKMFIDVSRIAVYDTINFTCDQKLMDRQTALSATQNHTEN